MLWPLLLLLLVVAALLVPQVCHSVTTTTQAEGAMPPVEVAKPTLLPP
jgi:hypothetical protein